VRYKTCTLRVIKQGVVIRVSGETPRPRNGKGADEGGRAYCKKGSREQGTTILDKGKRKGAGGGDRVYEITLGSQTISKLREAVEADFVGAVREASKHEKA